MTTLINEADVGAWLDKNKTEVTEIEGSLASQISESILGAISHLYSTENWLDADSTPLLIRKIISMKYAGYYYHRTFSNDSEPGVYGDRLLADAQALLDDIVNGIISIPASASVTVISTNQLPTVADELTASDPVFSMGAVY